MLRRALLLLAIVVLGLAGAVSSLLAAGPVTTTTTTTTTSTTTTTAVPSTTSSTTTATSVPSTSSTTTTTASTTTRPATTTSTTASTTATVATTTTTVSSPPPPPSITSTAARTVVFTGHGWGHGLGLAQWGAYGYALHGWTYDAILRHYYSGTTIGSAPGANVRVLLADEKPRVTLASAGPWRVIDAAGTALALPAGKLVLTKALTVNGQPLVSPLTFKSGAAPLQLGTTTYRGRFRVILAGTKLQVVNVVGIEPYLQGVVPSESPSSWPAEALKAQAVAARSYALAELTTVVTASNYDLFADTRSQVYGGIPAETPEGTKAVQLTAHQVVLYNGSIATTYFSSSSGGRTTSAAEAYGKPIPYLVSVPDPYDTYSPYHDWGPVLYDAATVAKAIGLSGQQLLDLQLARSASGRVRKVTATGSASQLSLSGGGLRSDLGLRSSWFSIGWLALDRVPAPVSYGGSVTLTGVARGVAGVTLEARTTGGTWAPMTQLVPDATGAFTTVVKPDVTTQYRLAAGPLHAGLVKAAVVPLVQASIGTDAVQGTIQPALAGSSVQLQLHDGTGWTTVGTGTTDSAGSFAVAAALAPGSYRVRCAPGHGLSPGVLSLSVP